MYVHVHLCPLKKKMYIWIYTETNNMDVQTSYVTTLEMEP